MSLWAVVVLMRVVRGAPSKRSSLVHRVCLLPLVVGGVLACSRDGSYGNETCSNRPPLPTEDPSPVASNRCIGANDIPAHRLPTYVRPPDDRVALATLIDSAGYDIASGDPFNDATAGNVCGGLEKELILIKQSGEVDYQILGGPVPHSIGFGTMLRSEPHWRAVAAADLDGDGYDEVIGIRSAADGHPDVLISKVDPLTCKDATYVASAKLRDGPASLLIDVAAGNFDGTGTQIVVLDGGHSRLVTARLEPSGTLVETAALALDARFPWRAIAAGDLDQDGRDEVIVARHVDDNQSDTVLVYKWNGSSFSLLATTTFGNTGNSDWRGMTAGDFNGDGRAAIALLKRTSSNFAIFDYPGSGTALRALATDDLDSAPGQDWVALTSTDWSGGDQGAAELIAVRFAHRPFRSNVFIYGDRFHRRERDSALEDTRAVWQQIHLQDATRPGYSPTLQQYIATLKDYLTYTHANVLAWSLAETCDDYDHLVAFLDATVNFGIDGRQLRVWVTLLPAANSVATNPLDCGKLFNCSLPTDSPLTPWNEYDAFTHGPNDDPTLLCKDSLGWATTIGLLAQRYPHLVSLGIDDFSFRVNDYSPEVIAEMASRMRAFAPWMTFVPTVYYPPFARRLWPDLALAFDTLLFFFRNDKHGTCIDDACGALQSIQYADEEVCFMKDQIPLGRKLQVGMYFRTYYAPNPDQTPSLQYDHDLLDVISSIPDLGGVVAYNMQANDPANVACSDADAPTSRYCILQNNYGSDVCATGQTRSCGACGTQTCTADCTWGACIEQIGVCTSGATSSVRVR